MKIQIDVQGMSCHRCTGRVEKYLKEQKGLSDIVVNLDGASAQFTCQADTDVDALVQGITELGYPASKKA